MTKKYEILDASNEVINTILADESFVAANFAHWRAVSDAPAAPHEVTMRQARLALYNAGMLDAAQAVIDALPMPQRRQAQIEWEYALSVRRDHPLIALMIAEGLATAEEVDGLFVAAAGL